jgi:hypothetical protein
MNIFPHVPAFNLIALIIFLCAVIHTFFAHRFNVIAHYLERKSKRKSSAHLFAIELLYFMGEVEVIFGLWVIPLAFVMTYFFNWETTVKYLDSLSYTEPLFVIVIMAVSATKPIIQIAEKGLAAVAALGGSSVKAWWWSILTVGPFLGAFITEPAAMTISAVLLSKRFYLLKPSKFLAYATLGLLFTNISVGGIITDFAAPLVLVVRKPWQWDTLFMFKQFGYKVVLGIILSNLIYFQILKKYFADLELKKSKIEEAELEEIPFWITVTHLLFLLWIVIHSHHPVIFIGSFMLFLGFMIATHSFQKRLELKGPLLVGFFLAGLLVHGNLQRWWIEPLISKASDEFLMVASLILTAFNDNAIITFLATLIPSLTDTMKYAIVSGAAAGGGLTIIANAPNPAGHSLLNRFFPDGISALHLFLGALPATLIMASIFYIFWQ